MSTPTQEKAAPLVSVIIPAYNAEKYISDTLSSILNQTVSDLEIIVCDDCSSDATVEVVNSFDDPRIRLIKNEINLGYIKTTNLLLREATGLFVAPQDADDISASTRFEKQLAVFANNSSIQLIFTNGLMFTNYGEIRLLPRRGNQELTIQSQEATLMPSVMMRRAIIAEFSGFNEYFGRLSSMDRYYYMEILEKHKGYFLDEILYFARMAPGSHSKSLSADKRKLIIYEVYLFLKNQRIKTGTDYLKEKDFASLRLLEENLLKNKNLLYERTLEHATWSVDAYNIQDYFKLAKDLFWTNPFNLKQYRLAFYALRNVFKRKPLEKKPVLKGSGLDFV